MTSRRVCYFRHNSDQVHIRTTELSLFLFRDNSGDLLCLIRVSVNVNFEKLFELVNTTKFKVILVSSFFFPVILNYWCIRLYASMTIDFFEIQYHRCVSFSRFHKYRLFRYVNEYTCTFILVK